MAKAKKNWIKGAINPKHKGYCTPMSKATCTPKRKALARTLKKMGRARRGKQGWRSGVWPESRRKPKAQSIQPRRLQ